MARDLGTALPTAMPGVEQNIPKFALKDNKNVTVYVNLNQN